MRKIKKLPAGVTVLRILLASDKTMMSLNHGNQVFGPVYVTINNLDAKTRRSQNWLRILLLGSIPIFYE